jgi:NADPH2 dehydrogenase
LRAQKAGLDGVELHGAHGYLLTQFFSPVINKRTDAYGGKPANRVRFAGEIIQKIRQSAGNKFIIGCRLGCNEPGLNEGIEIAKELEAAGADVLHVSSGMGTIFPPDQNASLPVPADFKFSWLVYGGSEIKKHVKIAVIVVNGIRTPRQANSILEDGLADMAALGKGLLVDLEWANKARLEKKVAACLGCKICGFFKRGAEPGEHCPRTKEMAGV